MKKIFILLLLLCLFLVGCNSDKVIKVGASSTPHALILEQCKSYVESKGYKLEIVVFDDYVLPNYAVENGELDANYFQHEPYLNEFNTANNTHIVSVFKVHFEPMGIYSRTKTDYTEGDTIVVPSDKSNCDRAIALLDSYGIANANIIMAEAQYIPTMLQDVDFAVINGNYALASGVLEYFIAGEGTGSTVANTMGNVIAVKQGNEENEKINLLIEALKQNNVKEYITAQFGNSVVYIGE